MMPILHSPGVMTPGQLGPMRCAFGFVVQERFDLDHVEHGDAFGDGDDDGDAGVGGFHDRVGREGRRDEDHRGVGAGGVDGLADGVEDRQAVGVFGAALAGGDAADHFGAVFEAAFGVERAGGAGDALADDFGFFVDEDAHILFFAKGERV